jgi:nucleoside-diphosphate-sugar epimerase
MSPNTGRKTALIIGATGVSGRSLLTHLETKPEWDIVAVSRTPPDFPTRARHVSADLMDPQSCRDAFASCADVTHVFYTAYANRPTIDGTREPNTRMFRNALEAITTVALRLQHVCLLQGTKYYGQYLGKFKTPAKERDPRHPNPHFYYDQEDCMLELQQRGDWTWSCPRPHVICGFALGNALNLISVLAVYGTMAREMKRPLTFPGKPGAFTSIYQATDAGLLARAMEWMATDPRCANQAFNVTNGDFFRYENLWPFFADYFGVEAAGVETVDLRQTMEPQEGVWNGIVEKYGLMPNSYQRVADWNFANYAFSNDWDVMSDTTKCRRFGFIEFIDSEEMFLRLFDQFRATKVIP